MKWNKVLNSVMKIEKAPRIAEVMPKNLTKGLPECQWFLKYDDRGNNKGKHVYLMQNTQSFL